MSFYIRAIKLMLDTNIPKQSIVPFTKSMLYHPLLKDVDDLDEYPYFTMDGLYPAMLIYNMSYSDQVRFFFNKTNMEYIMKRNSRVITDTNSQDATSPKKMDTLSISQENIMTMLRTLFPTKYPYKNNVMSSFAYITEQIDYYINPLDILPTVLRQMFIKEKADYSYLKINGKVYTVTQVVWLNDLYNHTEYKDLIDKLIKLNKFKEKEVKKLKDEYLKKDSLLKKKYTHMKQPDDINYDFNLENERKAKTDVSGKEIKRYNDAKEAIEYIIQIIPKIHNKTTQDFTIDEMARVVEYHKLLSGSEYRNYYRNVSTETRKYFDNMQRDVNDMRYLDYAISYLEKPGIDIQIEKDKPENRDRFKSRYPIYTNFIETIKGFILPKRDSSNPMFQTTFDEFISNTEVNGLFNYVLDPTNGKKTLENAFEELNTLNTLNGKLKIEKEDINNDEFEYMNRKNTGVTILSSAGDNGPYYQIYIQINTVGGELTDDNYSVIDCMYKGEYLGENLEYLLNSSLKTITGLNTVRVFFDITQGDAKQLIQGDSEKSAEANAKQIKGVPTSETVAEPKEPVKKPTRETVAEPKEPVKNPTRETVAEPKTVKRGGRDATKKNGRFNARHRFMQTMRKY